MKKPTLSVLMPNYNHAKFIGEALETILNQSYRPMEIIVSDHSSTDNSIEVIQQYIKRDSTIRLIKTEREVDFVQQANKLLHLANGDYVYFAAADDKVLPGLFEKTMNSLAQYPQAGFCCSDYFILDEMTGKGVLHGRKLRFCNKMHFFSPTEFAKLMRCREGALGGQTVILKRSALIESGGYNQTLQWYCDWFTYYVIGFRFGICYIPELLAIIRVSPESGFEKHNKQLLMRKKILRHVLYLLKSKQYCDVYPMFRKAGLLSRFKFQAIKVLLADKEYRDFLNFLLFRRAIMLEIVEMLRPVMPPIVKRIYNHIYFRLYKQI